MQRSMFAILSAIIDRAMASQPSAESPDHEHRQQKRDDHAHADEHIGENDSGALSMAIQYGQSSGSLMRALHPRISAAGAKARRPCRLRSLEQLLFG